MLNIKASLCIRLEDSLLISSKVFWSVFIRSLGLELLVPRSSRKDAPTAVCILSGTFTALLIEWGCVASVVPASPKYETNSAVNTGIWHINGMLENFEFKLKRVIEI